MYSLYRAWLSLGPPALPGLPQISSSLPPSSGLTFGSASLTTGPPDVTLHVGPNMAPFSAHKNVLSTHSGFFKAALANHNGNNFFLIISSFNIFLNNFL